MGLQETRYRPYEQCSLAKHRCKHICKPLQANPQTKVCKRASTSPMQEKLFFKISFPSKFFKTATAQTNTTMTVILNNDNGLQTRWTRTPAGNSVLPQLAVTCKIEAECSYQTFVQVDSEVLGNRQLRQHANRWRSFYGDSAS